MPELQKKDCFIVDESNKAAKSLMIKLCENVKPGVVIFVTREEFDCLKESVIRIEQPDPQSLEVTSDAIL